MTTPKGARHLAAMYENFSGSNPTSAALIDLANQVERLEAQRKELREALKKTLKQLNLLSVHMQCTADGNGPDCTDYFQAQINGSAALKATE